MSNLPQVWPEVEILLSDGISLIPVREKDEVNRYGKTSVAKSPYGKWKEFQFRKATKEELWHNMEEKHTTAVAIVCGIVSGNIEAIDIDVKFKSGIDEILFKDIQHFYPELFTKLRIHQTPSSGFHIIYRVAATHPVPGNLKLAGRIATEEEISLQLSRGISHPNREINFLETRGEGGYILAPPSLGYLIYKNAPIPVLSWEERCSLITLCQSYTEILKELPKPKPLKSEENWYDENPFEHFNSSADPIELAAGFGWKYSHGNNFFLWFTRPGKQSGVSMSWNLQKRIFYNFTSSTELTPNRGYHPSTLLSALKFSGDKRKTFKWLTEHGYGRVKPEIEKKLLKSNVAAGKHIPKNFSEEAKSEYIVQVDKVKEDYPLGVFIKYDIDEERYIVSREAIIAVAGKLGFRYYDGDLVQITGFNSKFVTERYFQDTLKNYLMGGDSDEYEKICNVYESFMQKNGKYTMQRLELLDTSKVLKDDKITSYKFYKNGYLTITAGMITFQDYSAFKHIIWADKIQPRDYYEFNGGKFVDFLNLATTNPDHASSVLGYLAHEYKDETTGYIIVLTEQCADPKKGGGSGKNVFCNLLRLTTTYTSKPGSQTKFDEKFFQSWNRQRIFGISDVSRNFDFAFLKEPATGSFIWKKLFKDEVEVAVEDAPKFIVQTNFSYENSDGGLRRRIIPVEFTNFFTIAGGLDVHYGCHFPNGWSKDDYAGFDTLIAKSIQKWLKGSNKLNATELTETGWIKQWEQTYGNSTGFILEYWDHWVSETYVTNETFKRSLEHYYNDNNIQKQYWPSTTKLNAAIASYGEKKHIGFKKDVAKRFSNGIFKCRFFYVPEDCIENNQTR
ncbi:bifunctional DNA primase/polymerase [Pedobacter antarcticus]|uniref:bifunctional DNA primase/polymerase n=1 Tax=Pedobacter antarcticus TaxID=34086 RepID=UPI00292D3216|nr:bifunctional DNA primase/polymerase [Pedobacter antarcticus]